MLIASHHLRAFYEIAQQGSFSKAAQALNLTQPALSHRITNLEAELATTLFIRDPAGLKLTVTGERLLRYCQVQSALEKDFLQDLQNPDAGLVGAIRIGSTSTLMDSAVLPALGDLVSQNSKIRVETYVREIRDLPKLLSTAAVDFVVSCVKIERDELETHQIGFERNVMIAPLHSSGREKIYLDHDAEDRTTIDFLKNRGKDERVLQRSFLDDIKGILKGVELGWGCAVVPRHLLGAHPKIRRLKSYGTWNKPVYLQYFRQPFYSRLHKEVVVALRSQTDRFLAGD